MADRDIPQTIDPNPPQEIHPTRKQRFMGALAGALSPPGESLSESPIYQNLQRHYAVQLAKAQALHRQVALYGAILASGVDRDRGIDEKTGKPYPLTDEQRQHYETLFRESMDEFYKIVGVNKETKAAFQKNRTRLESLLGIGGTETPGTMTPPPGMASAQTPNSAEPTLKSRPAESPTAAVAPVGLAKGPAPPSGQPPANMTPPPRGPAPTAEAASSTGLTTSQEAEFGAPLTEFELVAGEQSRVKMAELAQEAKVREEQYEKQLAAERTSKVETERALTQFRLEQAPKIGLTPGTLEFEEYVSSGKVSAAGLAPKRIIYLGDDNLPHFGFQVGGRLVDQEQNPLPPDVVAFSASLLPLTTRSQGFRIAQTPTGYDIIPVTTTTTRQRGGQGAKQPSVPALPPAPQAPSSKTAPSVPPKSAPVRPGVGPATHVNVPGKAPTGVAKAFQAYNASRERYVVMLDAYQKAIKGDQQAMINLLANHLGMTTGLQRGARITRAMWEEAAASAPWIDRVLARYTRVDPETGDRIVISPLSGVYLTPQQMYQMVQLAQVRATQDRDAWQREVEAAKAGYGMTQ